MLFALNVDHGSGTPRHSYIENRRTLRAVGKGEAPYASRLQCILKCSSGSAAYDGKESGNAIRYMLTDEPREQGIGAAASNPLRRRGGGGVGVTVPRWGVRGGSGAHARLAWAADV